MRLLVYSAVVIRCAFGIDLRAGEPGMPSTVADGAKLVELYSADAFFEGPVWHPGTGKLYFTLHKGKTTMVWQTRITDERSLCGWTIRKAWAECFNRPMAD